MNKLEQLESLAWKLRKSIMSGNDKAQNTLVKVQSKIKQIKETHGNIKSHYMYACE